MPTLNLSIFKYPLGFIRVVEFVFIIIATAAVNSWNVSLNYNCPNNSTHKVEVSTFSLGNAVIEDCKESMSKLWTPDDSAGGSAGFFYFVNVVALIYVLIIIFVYVIFWPLYQSEKRIALGDLAVTTLLFVLFFFCSATWWAASNSISYATSDERVTSLMKGNEAFWKQNEENLSLLMSANNGKLVVSVLSDWVCVFTFALNCWFIWKEVVPRHSQDPSQIA
ncbi:synaptophysin / synaptoporin [Dictyocaulus viviparus]|uniref:Synaptophysin / synaptoporin n=1 Tax=Dictyocaulus viviparus TaxID=29172 RepID=A0A0D8XZR1_DICVI|nr:synaptophysin / synaptoporin [Dictyocaulus viviparus]